MSDKKTNPHLYAIIAGEVSGDTLGAGLMKAILRHDPQAQFIGIGGAKMCKCGMVSSFKMEELSVMGIFEVAAHLVPILKIRSKITKILLAARPCVMIGIDSPDFNLHVERKLREAGIKTIHYVSPSVWAWREGRMKTIRAACDEVLALLPFEKEYFDKQEMPCTYVGHTLANSIPLESDQNVARERIGLYKNSIDPIEGKVLAILPGSRRGVISRMLPVYIKAARLIREHMKDVTFISVAPSYEIAVFIKDIWLAQCPEFSLTVFVDNSQDAIAASDVCLLSSGTVAFEAMLLKRPMVVGYKVSALTAAIARRLLKVNMYSLPNLLAKREIVKELIQENCTPENLANECIRLLTSDNLLMKKEFAEIHSKIRTNTDELAALAVFRVISTIDNADLAEGDVAKEAEHIATIACAAVEKTLTENSAEHAARAAKLNQLGETEVDKKSKKRSKNKDAKMDDEKEDSAESDTDSPSQDAAASKDSSESANGDANEGSSEKKTRRRRGKRKNKQNANSDKKASENKSDATGQDSITSSASTEVSSSSADKNAAKAKDDGDTSSKAAPSSDSASSSADSSTSSDSEESASDVGSSSKAGSASDGKDGSTKSDDANKINNEGYRAFLNRTSHADVNYKSSDVKPSSDYKTDVMDVAKSYDKQDNKSTHAIGRFKADVNDDNVPLKDGLDDATVNRLKREVDAIESKTEPKKPSLNEVLKINNAKRAEEAKNKERI